jgi:3'-phosphoadenosine 5'-phosphosulfate sulfotransferase (PAPS reductase)/FAD synthetase
MNPIIDGAPVLTSYHWILVNSSAGKDSQAMLDLVVELATAAGVRDRVVVVHCDLGRVEWAGTAELAEEQAKHYGLRFEKVSRPQGDLLDQIEARGMFPSSSARYCTSDHKRGQVRKVLTMLAKELADAGHVGPVRILNCMGLRAEESPARAKLDGFVRICRPATAAARSTPGSQSSSGSSRTCGRPSAPAACVTTPPTTSG